MKALFNIDPKDLQLFTKLTKKLGFRKIDSDGTNLIIIFPEIEGPDITQLIVDHCDNHSLRILRYQTL